MKILSILLVAFIIVSCQRDVSNDLPSNQGNGNNNNNQSTNDSIYLAKYVEVDTTLPAGQDTTIVYTFSYDGFKRIKNVKILEYYSSTYIYNYNIDYSYQSDSDTLPYKTVEVDVEPAISYSETHYFTYSNGFVSSDSSILYRITNNELLEKDLALYSSSGNSTFVTTRDSVFAPDNLYQHNGTVFKTYVNGNLTQQDDTTSSNNRLTGAEHFQMSYDDKINPLYRVDIRYPIYDEQGLTFEAGKNNILEEVATDDLSNAFRHNKYNFTYRADGYPLIVRKLDLLDPNENRTGFFFYNK